MQVFPSSVVLLLALFVGLSDEVTLIRRTAGTETEIATVVGNLHAESKNGWTVEEIPNPNTAEGAQLCGRNGTKHSYICDPNSYISLKEADKIDAEIAFIRKNVTLPSTKDHTLKDLQIGVCILDRIKRPLWGFGKIDVFKFGQDLFNQWGLGDPGAGNGILLLLSIADRKAAIVTGSSARLVVTDQQGSRIIIEMGEPLRAGNIGVAVEVALDRFLRAAHGLYNEDSSWSLWDKIMIVPTTVLIFYWSCLGCYFFVFVMCLPCLLCLYRYPLTWKYQGKFRKAKDDLRRIEEEQGRRKEAARRDMDSCVDKWQCPICLDDFSFTKAELARFRQYASMEQGYDYQETEPLRGAELYKESGMVLRCGHRFCQKCMEGWTQTTSATTPTASCPVCRTPIPGEFVGSDEERVQRQDLQFRLLMFRHRHSDVVNDALYRDWNIRVWSDRWNDRYGYSLGLERSFDLNSMIAADTTFAYLDSMNSVGAPGGVSTQWNASSGGGTTDWGRGSCEGGGGASGGW